MLDRTLYAGAVLRQARELDLPSGDGSLDLNSVEGEADENENAESRCTRRQALATAARLKPEQHQSAIKSSRRISPKSVASIPRAVLAQNPISRLAAMAPTVFAATAMPIPSPTAWPVRVDPDQYRKSGAEEDGRQQHDGHDQQEEQMCGIASFEPADQATVRVGQKGDEGHACGSPRVRSPRAGRPKLRGRSRMRSTKGEMARLPAPIPNRYADRTAAKPWRVPSMTMPKSFDQTISSRSPRTPRSEEDQERRAAATRLGADLPAQAMPGSAVQLATVCRPATGTRRRRSAGSPRLPGSPTPSARRRGSARSRRGRRRSTAPRVLAAYRIALQRPRVSSLPTTPRATTGSVAPMAIVAEAARSCRDQPDHRHRGAALVDANHCVEGIQPQQQWQRSECEGADAQLEQGVDATGSGDATDATRPPASFRSPCHRRRPPAPFRSPRWWFRRQSRAAGSRRFS